MGKAFTKQELVEMWKRTPEEQYNVMVSKILEAIQLTGGKISISWSGGGRIVPFFYMYFVPYGRIYIPTNMLLLHLQIRQMSTNIHISLLKSFQVI